MNFCHRAYRSWLDWGVSLNVAGLRFADAGGINRDPQIWHFAGVADPPRMCHFAETGVMSAGLQAYLVKINPRGEVKGAQT